MRKWVLITFLAVVLIGAGYFFGTVCNRISEAYRLILAPSPELLTALVWFLLAVAAVVVSVGLVAALVRPVWVGFVDFALSGLAMLLGWQVTWVSGVFVLLYLLAACVYGVGVAKDMSERLRFSVRSTAKGRGLLLIALAAAACGSLCIGYAAEIEHEGFSIPAAYTEMLKEQMVKQIEAQVPAADRDEVLQEFRERFEDTLDEFVVQRVRPYEALIPLIVAAAIFTPLVGISNLLMWVPALVLAFLFRLLIAVRVVKVVTETCEVERLVIA